MKQGQPKAARSDDGNAFLPDPTETGEPLSSNDATFFATEYVAAALTGESQNEDVRDEVAPDEDGGPFLVLNDEAELPPEVEDPSADPDGAESAKHEQALRGGRWAARGV